MTELQQLIRTLLWAQLAALRPGQSPTRPLGLHFCAVPHSSMLCIADTHSDTHGTMVCINAALQQAVHG